jgi:hypothetical protein
VTETDRETIGPEDKSRGWSPWTYILDLLRDELGKTLFQGLSLGSGSVTASGDRGAGLARRHVTERQPNHLSVVECATVSLVQPT